MTPAIVVDEVTLHPVSGPPVPAGRLVMQGGRIRALGSARSVAIPKGARVLHYRGAHVTPGLVDAHMHAGLHQQGVSGPEADQYNEISDPITSHLRAEDGINPRDRGFSDALSAGVTTVCVLPGSANVVGGLAVTLRTWGTRIATMMYAERPGMKIALGENPCRVYREQKKSPMTRMAIAALLRETFENARAYGREKPDPAVPRDHRLEALQPVLRRRLPLRVHAHRAHDIETALRVADELGIRVILDHCTEGHLIADVLARRGASAIVGPDLSTRTKLELTERRPDNAAILHRAGVKVALMSDHPVSPSLHFPLVAAVAQRWGLDAPSALRAVTLNPAEILGLDKKIGSLKVGKHADVVVWSGPPLDAQSAPLAVFGEGVLVHGTEAP